MTESADQRIKPVGRPIKYPWAAMQVGDKFIVENAKATTIHSAGIQWAKRHGHEWRFTTNKTKEGQVTIKRTK